MRQVRFLPAHLNQNEAMHPNQVKRLLGRNVLLEAVEESTTESGLFIPIASMERYPSLARIISLSPKCQEALKVGDLALLSNEGTDTDNTYWKAMYLKLKDWPDIEYVDLDECWQPIRDAVYSYRRKGEDLKIRVCTTNGEWLTMDASDILDYGVEDISHPGFRLEYVNCFIFWFEYEGLTRLFYLTSETQILATLETA